MKHLPPSWRPLLTVVAVCLALNAAIATSIAIIRPAYLEDYRLSGDPDSQHYVLLGRNTFLHGCFSRCEAPPYVPDAFRTPGYCLFAGGLEWLGRAGTIYFVQVLLHAGSCVLLFSFVRDLFGPRPAFWAALLLATDLTLGIFNFMIMSEPLFVFLVVGAAAVLLPAALAPADRRFRWARLALAGGLLLGLAILTRPAGLYLPLVLALGFVGVGLFRKRVVVSVVSAAIMLAVAWLPAAGWIARNAALFSLPRLTHNQSNVLIYFFGAGAYQVEHGVSLEQAQAMISEEYGIVPVVEAQNAHAFGRDVAEIDAQQRAVVWKVVTKYPRSLLVSSATGIVKASLSHATADLAGMLSCAWTAPGSRALVVDPARAAKRLGENAPLLRVAFVWQVAHVVTALGATVLGMGLVLLNRKTRAAGILLLMILAYFYLTVALFGLEAYCRSRIPALPFLYAFAGYAFSRVLPGSKAAPSAPDETVADGPKSNGYGMQPRIRRS